MEFLASSCVLLPCYGENVSWFANLLILIYGKKKFLRTLSNGWQAKVTLTVKWIPLKNYLKVQLS